MSKETLKQIKEQYARELHYSSWQFMCEDVNIVPHDVSVIAERYAASLLIEAQERIKELEECIREFISLEESTVGYAMVTKQRIIHRMKEALSPNNKPKEDE